MLLHFKDSGPRNCGFIMHRWVKVILFHLLRTTATKYLDFYYLQPRVANPPEEDAPVGKTLTTRVGCG